MPTVNELKRQFERSRQAQSQRASASEINRRAKAAGFVSSQAAGSSSTRASNEQINQAAKRAGFVEGVVKRTQTRAYYAKTKPTVQGLQIVGGLAPSPIGVQVGSGASGASFAAQFTPSIQDHPITQGLKAVGVETPKQAVIYDLNRAPFDIFAGITKAVAGFQLPSFGTGSQISGGSPSQATPSVINPPKPKIPFVQPVSNYPQVPEGLGVEQAQPLRFGSLTIEDARAQFSRANNQSLSIPTNPFGGGGGSGGSRVPSLFPSPTVPPDYSPDAGLPPSIPSGTDAGTSGGYPINPTPQFPTVGQEPITPSVPSTGGGFNEPTIPTTEPTFPTFPPSQQPPMTGGGGGGQPSGDGKCRNIFGQEVPCGGGGILDNPIFGGAPAGGGFSLLGLLLLLLLLAWQDKKERKKTVKAALTRRLTR